MTNFFYMCKIDYFLFILIVSNNNDLFKNLINEKILKQVNKCSSNVDKDFSNVYLLKRY